MEKRRKNKQTKGPRGTLNKIHTNNRKITRVVQSIQVERNQPFFKLPRGDNVYVTRQALSNFNSVSGISNLGGNTPGQLVANSGNAVTGFGFYIGFEFADMAQEAQWATVFDQYKVEEWLVRFKSRNNAVNLANTASPNAGVPTGYCVIDRDDATLLTTSTGAQAYDNVRVFSGEEDFTVRMKPSITPSIFSSGAFSGYGVETSDQLWLDVASTAIPHYGIKGWVSGLTIATTSAWVWDITAEVLISFRNTR